MTYLSLFHRQRRGQLYHFGQKRQILCIVSFVLKRQIVLRDQFLYHYLVRKQLYNLYRV